MITSDLENLIETIQKEKNIPRDVVIEILESAMVAAARKKFGMTRDIEAMYNQELGEVELSEWRTVVDEIEDPDLEIELEEARDEDPGFQVGDSYGRIMEASALGRIAAQTAKQVIIQKIRDAERELTFNEFKDRKGELITGIVRRFEKGNIIVDLNRAEAILPRREQVPTETYRPGDRIQAYVLDITRATRQPQVVLSRTHQVLLMKLFEIEVPEIYEGIVTIEACAREPGHRAKIAVSSTDADVDPVGACVGLKGSRVQAVVSELRGEAIDIIPWHPEPGSFIVYAIAPASVSRVYIDEGNHTMELIVPDDQLAKAIGRRGQNVRLAAQLTGWRIDIFSETKHVDMLNMARNELARIPSVDEAQVEDLVGRGFQKVVEVAESDAGEIAAILGVDEEAAQQVVAEADKVVEQLIMEEAERRKEGDDTPRRGRGRAAPDPARNSERRGSDDAAAEAAPANDTDPALAEDAVADDSPADDVPAEEPAAADTSDETPADVDQALQPAEAAAAAPDVLDAE